MLKSMMRFILILLIAVALGVGFYYLVQPAGQASLRSGIGNFRNVSGDFGGEHGFREGSFSLIGGLFGITANLMLIALVTFIVISIQKIFSDKPETITTR
jgi:hypothetical protein